MGEFTQGVEGYAFTHEWLFWLFESLPMLVVITVYCVYFPSKHLGPGAGGRKANKSASAEEGYGSSELADVGRH